MSGKRTDDRAPAMAHDEQLPNAELLQWSVTSHDDEVEVSLVGEIDVSNVAALRRVLRRVVDAKPVKVNVDLARVSFLGSTGVQCLLEAAQAAAEAGSKLLVLRPTELVLRVLKICGVDEVLLADSDRDISGGSSRP
jgi:anti-anti-sigma factor